MLKASLADQLVAKERWSVLASMSVEVCLGRLVLNHARRIVPDLEKEMVRRISAGDAVLVTGTREVQ